MAAADLGMAGLVAASDVGLRETQTGLAGACPRCSSRLVVDNAANSWRCAGGCGSGGPAEWVALTQGVSVTHASALLDAGWRPGDGDAHTGERTARLLAPLCSADADDATLLDAVVTHYAKTLPVNEQARSWLAQLGVDDELAARLRIGVSNRTLGYRLPLAAARQLTVERAQVTTGKAVVFTRRELRERLGTTEHQVRVGLARLVALEYLAVVPGPAGLPHRYTLTDPPDPSELGEPGDTLRDPCEIEAQGSEAVSPAETPDPAPLWSIDNHTVAAVGDVDVDVPTGRRRRRRSR